MNNATIEPVGFGGGVEQLSARQWISQPALGLMYRLHVAVYADEEGSVCASLLDLPGVHDFGDSAQEAVSRVLDTFKDVLRTYRAAQETIPWQDDTVALAAVENEYQGVEVRHEVVSLDG